MTISWESKQKMKTKSDDIEIKMEKEDDKREKIKKN